MALYTVTVQWLDEVEDVTVQASDPDDACAEVVTEIPEHWPDEGWDVLEVVPESPY